MAKLLMISGDRSLAEGKHGAFYNTLEEFYKHWDRIDVICPKVNRGETSIGAIEVSPRFGNVFIHSSPWPLICQPWFVLKKGFEIYKEQKFNLMTVHEYPPFYNGLGARLLWQKIKVPYILEIFHIPGYPEYSGIKEFIYRSLVRVFISYDASRAKAVRIMNPVRSSLAEVRRTRAEGTSETSFGMNTSVADFLINSGVPKSKLVYIPAIYVDLETYKPSTLKPSKEYDLIFVGRLEKNKGVSLLLEALKILSDTHNLNPKTLIVGDGPLKEDLKLKIKNLKLQDNVLLHGYAKDSHEIAELINKSKILVMPSYNEGGPRVVVEAMACGVPVLATPVGIVPDLLKNGSGGEIIDWDAEDIAQKIAGLLGDSEAYKKHSQAGIGIAQKFEKKAAIKNYADKLKEFI